MATVDLETPPLTAGDNLTRERFQRLWELNPDIKKAELIGGIVYMPAPLSVEHGGTDNDFGGWFFTYKVATPGILGHSPPRKGNPLACPGGRKIPASSPSFEWGLAVPRFPWPVA